MEDLKLPCKLCRKTFESRLFYLEHILRPSSGHVNLARKELLKNWKDLKLIKRVAVVFSKVSVVTTRNILELFSREPWASLVKDFVWFEENNKVGFVLFESRENMELALTTIFNLDKCQYQIFLTSQFYDVKPGSSFLWAEGDWDRLLPPSLRTDQDFLIPDEVEQAEVQNSEDSSDESDFDLQDFNLSPADNLPSLILNQVHSQVTISEEDFSIVQNLSSALGKIFTHGDGAHLTPFEFQLWLLSSPILRLRHHQDHLKFLILFKKETDPDLYLTLKTKRFLKIKDILEKINKILTGYEPQKYFEEGFPKMKFERVGRQEDFLQYEINSRGGFPSRFSISGENARALEAQLWLLAKHLLSFDPRIQPVLEIIFYWANLNSVKICEDVEADNYFNISEPLALTWLVLFFCAHKKSGKLIPPPYKLMEKSHERLQPFSDGADLGFSSDSQYPTSFMASRASKPHFNSGDNSEAFEVLFLAGNFFLKLGDLLQSGDWVINARNGSFLGIKHFLNLTCFESSKKGGVFSGNTVKEWGKFQGQLEKDQEYLRNVKGLGFDSSRIRFVIPFNLNYYFLLDGKVFEKFFETGKKLQSFLSGFKKGKVNKGEFVFGEDLFKI